MIAGAAGDAAKDGAVTRRAHGHDDRGRVAASRTRLELGQRSADVDRLDAMPAQDLDGLVAVAGDADDDRLVARHRAALDELARRGHRDAAGRLGEDALGLGQQLDALDDLVLLHHRAAAARRSHRAQHLEAVGGIADRDRLRDRVRLHRIGKLEPGLERADDGRAAGGLRRVNRRQVAVDEADASQFLEALQDSRQQRAAGDRRDDVLRESPAELLGDLEAGGLRAFGVVRAQVDVREAPAVLVRHLRAQPVHIVVVAADGDDARAVDGRAGDLAGLEIVGNEDRAGRARAARRATRRCWRDCPSTRRRTP